MAQGDITAFARFKLDYGTKVHGLAADVIKLGLITNSVTPTATTTDPRWGAGGTTNFSSTQVTPGGNYSTGGPTITTTTYTLSGTTATFDGDNVSILQNASNPTNARWGIIYNNTSAGKECLHFLDLGSVFDMSSGDLTVTFAVTGIHTLA